MTGGGAPKRIAVIGAGPAGLVTVKELLDEGHRPTCFERAGGLGGAFRFDEREGVIWESVRLTSSGLLTAFSDFPVPPDHAGHMLASEYLQYLRAYADAFGVSPHLRLRSRVEAVTGAPGDGWRVTWSDTDGTHHEDFDGVAVCSGLSQHPHVPRFEGDETFPGEILHAAYYRRPQSVAGKKVLVVGGGESGADLVAEVAANAKETVLSLRRGVAILSRRIFGQPRDYRTSRIANSASHWVFQTRNPADDRKRNVYRILFLPLVIVDKGLQILFRVFWETLPLFLSFRPAEIRTNLRTRRLTRELLEESGGTLFEQFVTKDDEFVRAIATGACRRAQAIERFDGSRVIFEDGSEFEPDTVILATGFETRTPFLEPSITTAPRYLYTFHPRIGASLGFIGFVRPGIGAIPPLAELQARWFALVQSGKRELPSEGAMRDSIERWGGYRAHVFRALGDRLPYLVDYMPFCDELADQMGCKPTRSDLDRESLAFRLRFFAGPFVSAQYRMVGPHAKPELARAIIEGLPIVHPWPDLANLYLRWTMSRALHRTLGPDYAPKLALSRPE